MAITISNSVKKYNGLSIKDASVLRLIYECGYVNDEVLKYFFKPKKLKNSKDKKYEVYRSSKFRKYMRELQEKTGLVESFGYTEPGKYRISRGYFLTAKGYRYVKDYLRDMDTLYTNCFGKEKRQEVLVNMDISTNYRRIGPGSINYNEITHHEMLIKLKIVCMIVFNRRIILHDMVHKDDGLFTNERCDLLIDIGNDEFIGLEYEKSEKTKRQYLGYSYMLNRERKTNPGVIRSRQKDGFLPHPYSLKFVIVVCKNDPIMVSYMRHIEALMKPDIVGKYVLINKFFVTSAEHHDGPVELMQNGEFVYCRKLLTGEKRDYQRFKMGDILSRDITEKIKLSKVSS